MLKRLLFFFGFIILTLVHPIKCDQEKLMFRPAFESTPETAPLTIFYNGTVAVFDVPRDKVGEDKKIMSIQKSPVIICLFFLLRKKIHWELFLRYSTRINFTGGNHFEACRKWTLQVC